MIYYAAVLFILLNGEPEMAISVPVGPTPDCGKVWAEMIRARVAQGGVKGYKPQCVVLPAPK